jgi:hypothetical protein
MAAGGPIVLTILALGAAGPAFASDLRDLCPDRPSKGTSPCTVDKGHLQLEADILDATLNRHGGVSDDSFVWANPTVKYGLTDNIEVAVNIPPLVRLRSHDDASGATQRAAGIGDLTLSVKANLTGNRPGWGVALAPFLKAPIAHAPIGNGAWEGGVLLPIAGGVGGGWSLDLTPEVDVVEDGAGGGHHAVAAASLGLSHGLGAGVSGTVEVWSQADFDPVGTTRQYSFDLALAWIPNRRPNLQLDGGVNLGLNRETPDVEAYVGVTRRF